MAVERSTLIGILGTRDRLDLDEIDTFEEATGRSQTPAFPYSNNG